MEFDLKIKDNGKPCMHFSQNGCGVVNPKGSQQFKYKKQNMFISEYKKKDIDGNCKRKFVVSIRMDGRDENEGEVKLTQMNFDENELLELKIQIGALLKCK